MSPADPRGRSPKAARCRRPYLSPRCISDTPRTRLLCQEPGQGRVRQPSDAAAGVSLPLRPWGQAPLLLAGYRGSPPAWEEEFRYFQGPTGFPVQEYTRLTPARLGGREGPPPPGRQDPRGRTSRGRCSRDGGFAARPPKPGPFTAPISWNRNNPKDVSIVQGFNELVIHQVGGRHPLRTPVHLPRKVLCQASTLISCPSLAKDFGIAAPGKAPPLPSSHPLPQQTPPEGPAKPGCRQGPTPARSSTPAPPSSRPRRSSRAPALGLPGQSFACCDGPSATLPGAFWLLDSAGSLADTGDPSHLGCIFHSVF